MVSDIILCAWSARNATRCSRSDLGPAPASLALSAARIAASRSRARSMMVLWVRTAGTCSPWGRQRLLQPLQRIRRAVQARVNLLADAVQRVQHRLQQALEVERLQRLHHVVVDADGALQQLLAAER